MTDNSLELIRWYRDNARPFLQRHLEAKKVEEFDRYCKRLAGVDASLREEVSVCFLGSSGVGKSTLINALLGSGQPVVPAGGIGPLTAQALVVRYGKTPKIEVAYHGAERLNQLAFGLENSWRDELLPNSSQSASKEAVVSEGESQRREAKAVAQLLITGKQSSDESVRYLLDGIREALGHERSWGTKANSEDANRIARLRKALALSKNGKRFVKEGTAEELALVLDDHASGFLAPLIRTAEIWWNSTLLKSGTTLVDLPGLGVVGDPRPEVTRQFLREKARVLVLVVDSRGITEPVAHLLRNSEFLMRLLHTSDDAEWNPVLFVAVTRVDDIANTNRLKDRSQSFAAHFAQVCEEMVPYIRDQLRCELETLWMNDGEPNQSKRNVISHLLRTLRVHPVSAVQYEALLSDDVARLSHVDETNIPAMAQSIEQVCTSQLGERRRRVQVISQSLLEGVLSEIRLIEARWSNSDRRSEEVEQLRRDLDAFMLPLRMKYSTLQGQYREFLRQATPQRIADLVRSGKQQSKNQIRTHLKRLGTAHWATLRASVRRGGRFSGKTDVDLQRDFVLYCEEPLAQAWGQEILKDIRKRTSEYSGQCFQLVEQIAAWARAQGARIQQPLVEAQKNSIKADADRLKTVGKEMIREVQEKNSSLLHKAIDPPIRLKCERFVNAHEDVGRGVKVKILELFDRLADEVPDAAEQPAACILKDLFREVEEEILQALGRQQSPLEAMADAIVTSQEQYLQRSDSQKRKPILEEAARLIANAPQLPFQSVAA